MIWIVLIFVIILAIFYLHHERRKRFPPGPFSLPILGTVEGMAIIRERGRAGVLAEEKFYKYGPMTTFYVGPLHTFIVINDFHLAKELFNRDEFSGTILC